MPRTHGIRLANKQTAFSEIPMVDIVGLVNGSDAQGVAQKLRKVCEEVGFFYVKNHGVSKDLVQAMYQASQEFFGLPWETKQRMNVVNSGLTLRGYIPPYGEDAGPGKARDIKEAFDYGVHSDDVLPFFGPNLMPAELPEFKETCETYHEAMVSLARKLVSAIALSLDLPADYFAEMQRNPITIQRLLHHPAQHGQVFENELGTGAHTGFGFLTILSQDNVGGLQVCNSEGSWVSAPPIEGTFIVGIGDLVQTMTNGRYSSTMHRVINTSGAPRYSIPFFFDLDFHAVVEPLPTCLDEEPEVNSDLFTCGQYKYGRYVDVYPHLKSATKALASAS